MRVKIAVTINMSKPEFRHHSTNRIIFGPTLNLYFPIIIAVTNSILTEEHNNYNSETSPLPLSSFFPLPLSLSLLTLLSHYSSSFPSLSHPSSLLLSLLLFLHSLFPSPLSLLTLLSHYSSSFPSLSHPSSLLLSLLLFLHSLFPSPLSLLTLLSHYSSSFPSLSHPSSLLLSLLLFLHSFFLSSPLTTCP